MAARTTQTAARHAAAPAALPRQTAISTAEPPIAAPVFVDPSGRRRRWIKGAALGVGGILGAYFLAVALSFLGGPMPPGALLPIPGLPNRAAPNSAAASPGASGATSSATSRAGAGGLGAPGSSSGSAQVPAAAPSGAASPTASPAAASPSPTAHRPTVPPGQVVKSASPSTSGHRR